jgi:hypothetical protein
MTARPQGGGDTDLVRTWRSDGAVFPAVRQTRRQQDPRRTRVSASTQALPAEGSWEAALEPPGGGRFVAPAGSVEAEPDLPVILELPVPPLRSPR